MSAPKGGEAVEEQWKGASKEDRRLKDNAEKTNDTRIEMVYISLLISLNRAGKLL